MMSRIDLHKFADITFGKLKNCFSLHHQTWSDNGAYITYVGRRPEGFNFFKKKLMAQETKDLNISWPSNFFRKYFMASPINFSFLFKVYL